MAWERDELSEPAFFAELARRTRLRLAAGCEQPRRERPQPDRLLTRRGRPGRHGLGGPTACRPRARDSPRRLHRANGPAHRRPCHPGAARGLACLRNALARLGPVPSLLEWDTDIPCSMCFWTKPSKPGACWWTCKTVSELDPQTAFVRALRHGGEVPGLCGLRPA